MRLLALLALVATPAFADGFQPVHDKDHFLDLIEGRYLRIGLYNLTLQLTPDGTIRGKALGWQITGKWIWQNGYFCREMDWEGMAIPWNCQLVEVRDDTLRFTVDKGAGDSASFRLR